MLSSQLPADLQLQIKVSKLIGFGFGLTLADRTGVAAPFAIAFGLRAKRLIESSDVPISGLWMAWWCIVVGILNVVIGLNNLLYLLTTFYQR